ncbi:MAG: ABC transporter ATP-binding protein [Acidimicrobiia bacterium]|nr:ABC transporter ATP-binding protein [Acidimicrobiia bacterium]
MTQRSDDIAIHAHGLTKRFGERVALDRFELDVPKGQILALLGPSGCGKTTALRVIAGFESPDTGSISISGREVVGLNVDVPAHKRRVGMVFQDYALFPHLSVGGNVGYGLATKDPQRIAEVLEFVGMAGYESHMPHRLSGGEQQRVALARALAPRPDVILLDEPFSNLDAPQRDRMRREVRSILTSADATALFVTHDQEEAFSVADVVAVMREGAVVQVGSPDVVYGHPVDAWVADFVGESVFIAGHAAVGMVETSLGSFPNPSEHRGRVTVMIRPEWVHPIPDQDGAVSVAGREFYGHDQLVYLDMPDGLRLRSRIGPTPLFRTGERVSLAIDEIVVFPGASSN